MDSLEAFDLGFLYWFGHLHRPWLDRAAEVVTPLGDPWVLFGVGVLSVVGFLAARRPRGAAVMAVTGILAWLLEWMTKLFVCRQRPDVVWRLIRLPNEFSFPSGHALVGMAMYGALGLILSRHVRPGVLRWLVAASGIVLGLLIGLTRPYLGVHYPKDVFAGWCAGLACALLAYLAMGPAPAKVGTKGPRR
jgi:undecaprenyl-diphosphatase